MIYTEPLFLGVTPTGARNYLASTVASLEKPFFNACAGRFSVVEGAIKAGLPSENIYASDIGLFSSIIGYLADPSKKLDDLGIRILDPALEPKGIANELDFAAHVMLILKLNQMKQTNLRGLYLREELLSSWEKTRAVMQQQLQMLLQNIAGIHYEIADIWDVVSSVSQEDVTFYASVPHYARGYTKMFAAPNLKWNEPAIPEFEPKSFPLLLEKLGPAKCHAFLCRRCEWEEPIPVYWKKVYGKPDEKRALWIIANRPMDARAENTTGFGGIRKLPIYDDHEITPASKFHVIMVGLPTALYYRDLFVHRLGTTTADRGFLLLVDVTGLTRSQIAAKQLAHNAIEGQDNDQLLAEIYRQIEDAESKLEAFIDQKLDIQLPKVKIEGLDVEIDFKTVLLIFLPRVKERLDRALEYLRSSGQRLDGVYIAADSDYAPLEKAVRTINEEYDVRVVADIIGKMADLALEASGVSVEGPERVHLKDIFGTTWVPKEAGTVIRDAVQKMVKAGDIGQTNRWQALEYWAAEYSQQ